jgi:hypothetical protein
MEFESGTETSMRIPRQDTSVVVETDSNTAKPMAAQPLAVAPIQTKPQP